MQEDRRVNIDWMEVDADYRQAEQTWTRILLNVGKFQTTAQPLNGAMANHSQRAPTFECMMSSKFTQWAHFIAYSWRIRIAYA